MAGRRLRCLPRLDGEKELSGEVERSEVVDRPVEDRWRRYGPAISGESEGFGRRRKV